MKTFFANKFILFFLLFFVTGCAPYKKRYDECISRPLSKIELEASSHPVYSFVPRHRDQVAWYDLGHLTTWAIFGNDDGGLFNEAKAKRAKRPVVISWQEALRCFCRNPFHNFSFYVIGQKGTPQSEFTLFAIRDGKMELWKTRKKGSTFPNRDRSSFFLGFHGYKPFISCRVLYGESSRSDFYIGWREKGNFGLKLIPQTTYTKKETKKGING